MTGVLERIRRRATSEDSTSGSIPTPSPTRPGLYNVTAASIVVPVDQMAALVIAADSRLLIAVSYGAQPL